jgi:hypothetical protein
VTRRPPKIKINTVALAGVVVARSSGEWPSLNQ